MLDALASEGVVLTSHYTWNWCAPSRGALLTGIYAPRNGYALNASGGDSGSPSGLPLNWTLIPALLREKAGYATVGVGKWHLGYYNQAMLPESRGFDRWLGYLGGAEDYYYHNYSSRACKTTVTDLWSGTATESQPANSSAFFPQYSPYLFTQFAVDSITQHCRTAAAAAAAAAAGGATATPTAPLFLYFAMQSVHAPLEVPEVYYKLYSAEAAQGGCPAGAPDGSDGVVRDVPCMSKYAGIEGGDDCFCNRLVVKAMSSAMDDAVGNLTSALRDNGMWHNTVLVFIGDNGGPTNNAHNNYPLKGGKLNWWEGGVRPAAFVSSPLLPAASRGRTFHGIVHETDWLPTFAALAGVLRTGVGGGGGGEGDGNTRNNIGSGNSDDSNGTLAGVLPYRLDGRNVWPTLCDPGATMYSHRGEALIVRNVPPSKKGGVRLKLEICAVFSAYFLTCAFPTVTSHIAGTQHTPGW